MRGIDISQFQGNVNFKKVKKSGIEFVMIRAGFGRYETQRDPYFEKNYKAAKAAGLHVGAYWYSYAQSVDDAKQEAKVCMKIINGKQFDFPIFFDLEERSQFAKGRDHCDGLVKAFCGELENNGWFAGLYISRSPLQTYISPTVAKRYGPCDRCHALRCHCQKTRRKGTAGTYLECEIQRLCGTVIRCLPRTGSQFQIGR